VIAEKSGAWYVRKISQFPVHNGKFNSQTWWKLGYRACAVLGLHRILVS
jgi:hypothetical protein